MRRFFLRGFLGLCLLTTVSCTKPGVLAPGDVLRRAALAGATVHNAAVSFRATMRGTQPWAGTITFLGTMQQGGQLLQGEAQVSGSTTMSGAAVALRFEGEVKMDWGRELYVRAKRLDLPQQKQVLSSLDTWFRIPLNDDSTAVRLTPDPRLMQAQVAVIQVVTDKGIESLEGHDAYHYEVVLDRDKLLSFVRKASEQNGTDSFDESEAKAEFSRMKTRGDLWIDASSFVVRRVQWRVEQASALQEQPTSVQELQADVRPEEGTIAPVFVPTEVQVLPRQLFEAAWTDLWSGSGTTVFSSQSSSDRPLPSSAHARAPSAQ